MSNYTESKFAKLMEKDGWLCIQKGWPDFLCIKGNKFILVEVKSKYDALTETQIKMHLILKKIGLKVHIWYPGYSRPKPYKEGLVGPESPADKFLIAGKGIPLSYPI